MAGATSVMTATTAALALTFFTGVPVAHATHFAGGEIIYRTGLTEGPPIQYPTIDIELVSLSLTSSNPSGEVVPLPEVSQGEFNVDSFFDVFTEVSIGGQIFNVDSFFDITYRIKKRPDLLASEWDELIDDAIMTLTVPGGPIIQMRESPTRNSIGEVVITDLPDGNFRIDSFFDVWTEISVDGGEFVPASSPMRIVMDAAVPEPASLALLGMGGLALIRRGHKQI